ncbi:MAG: hypothetical protein A2V74_12790 [Acidobacteria bacterium RBG_16_70_10]|nr:MAG: hypothetical protein A2V74_12790 [Acidobacteria bacterium RBG_16_70_10]
MGSPTTALVLAATLTLAETGYALQAAGRFHLVRSTSGSRGTQVGERFVIEDPRGVFYAGQDRQVLVLFEWQGPAGRHRCEGTWKDPSGRAVFTSESELISRGPRFGVYWGLSLPDVVAVGTWVLEARVDGEPAGAHAFQIVAGQRADTAPLARRTLDVAELYQRGLAATLTIEALDSSGAPIGVGSGLFVAPGLVLTTFGAINAARAVRLRTGEGRRFETSEVASWNRHDDWAVLRTPAAEGQPIQRAATEMVVGDRCYFLEAQSDGSRVIVETTVVGRSAAGDLVLNDPANDTTHGSPVLNEHGEAAATIAGHRLLGATLLDIHALGDAAPGAGALWSSSRARPLGPPPVPSTASRTLQDLENAGEFVRPLARIPHFVQGVLGTGVEKEGPVPVAAGQRSRFSRGDGVCVVFVTWTPARKEDASVAFEVFNEENRHLGGSEPRRVKLRPSQSFVHSWSIDLARLKPGIYRVDVVLGTDPVWRTFFRVTD